MTRNRGTVGGSIAHADGAAELPLCLVALGGTVVVEGAGRAARDRGRGASSSRTSRRRSQPGELVVETVWPHRDGRRGERVRGARAARGRLRAVDGGRRAAPRRRRAGVTSAAVAVGAVTDRPTRLAEVGALLVGSSGGEAAADAGALAAPLVDPPGSIHASARYLPRADRRRSSSARDREGRVTEIELTVNGRRRPGDRRAAAPADRLPPPPPRAHRHPRRLRARRLRRLHGAPRRRLRPRLLRARGAGRRQPGRDGRVARRERPAQPLQEAFRRHHALQCGFCTPGILMAATDLLSRGTPDARGDRRHALRATSAAARATRRSSTRSRQRRRREGGSA